MAKITIILLLAIVLVSSGYSANLAINNFVGSPVAIVPTVRSCDTCNFLLSWGSSGTGKGQFNGPEGIAVDSSGNVYVADSFSNRVEKFTSTGIYVTQWGCSSTNLSVPACTAGSGDGQFNNPVGVAVDASGNVYVADTANNNVQKFGFSVQLQVTQPTSISTGATPASSSSVGPISTTSKTLVTVLTSQLQTIDRTTDLLKQFNNSACRF